MTVSSISTQTITASSGAGQVAFLFDFPLINKLHIDVFKDDILESSSLYTVDYTIGDQGGQITYSVSPTIGSEIRLRRNTPLSQDLQFPIAGPFPSRSHESGLDKLIMVVQEILFAHDEELGGTDTDAIHDNVSSEISVLPEKTSPIGSDHILIEDSAIGNSKRRIQISNLSLGSVPTHTGEVTGDTNLTLDITAITNRSDVVADSADDVAIHDDSDGTLKKVNLSSIGDAGYF